MSKQQSISPYLFKGLGTTLEFLSGEYALTRLGMANGGTVVFFRAAHVSVIAYLTIIGLMNWIDPIRSANWDAMEFRFQLIDNAELFGALFAGSYAALYTRFASQWAYLANVYNQMKAAQARQDCDPIVLAEWRAGFIEDCDELHLVRKPMFASVVFGLLADNAPGVDQVRAVFDSYTPGGTHRRERIFAEVTAVVKKVRMQYQ